MEPGEPGNPGGAGVEPGRSRVLWYQFMTFPLRYAAEPTRKMTEPDRYIGSIVMVAVCIPVSVLVLLISKRMTEFRNLYFSCFCFMVLLFSFEFQ